MAGAARAPAGDLSVEGASGRAAGGRCRRDASLPAFPDKPLSMDCRQAARVDAAGAAAGLACVPAGAVHVASHPSRAESTRSALLRGVLC
eukprot:366175-Chlamydomonas_euryale.AAC.17